MTKEMGFNVVVDKSQVLFAKKALDITELVMAELDKKVPKVEVPNPGN
jgi:Skp family chaperone for outer membrane proteins